MLRVFNYGFTQISAEKTVHLKMGALTETFLDAGGPWHLHPSKSVLVKEVMVCLRV